MSTSTELLFEGSYLKLRAALETKQISSVELTKASLDKAKQFNTQLNSYISFCEELALEQAKNADEKIAKGENSALLGIPIAVKDLILVKDYNTTAASKMLENFKAPYDASVVGRLKDAGSPIVGKTNLDEFAMGSSNESSFFGECKNPWDKQCVPGGSSGGSAVSVASRSVSLSLGTDTGGSIRQPSSFCGITGLKPTYGRVSRFGVVAFASSLDQVGPMCSDALSCAAVMDVISGADIHDATCTDKKPSSSLSATLNYLKAPTLKGLKIGIVKEFLNSAVQPEVQKATQDCLDFYTSQGAELVEISLKHIGYSLPCYYLICTSEASSNLARYDGVRYGHRSSNKELSLTELYEQTRSEGFGDEVKRRIMLGTYSLSSGYYDAYFQKAAQARRLIKQDFDQAFKKVDVIASPTSPFTAFKLGEKINNPLEMYAADVFTLATNLAGLPGISFNVGYDKNKLPIGFQLQAPRWEEISILSLAAYYQQQHPENHKGVML